MGDYRQTSPAAPLQYLRPYKALEFKKLGGKILYATFRGEVVYLVLISPLEAEDLQDLAAYLDMWRRNDYCRIYLALDPWLATPGLRVILAGRGVDLVLEEAEFGEASKQEWALIKDRIEAPLAKTSTHSCLRRRSE